MKMFNVIIIPNVPGVSGTLKCEIYSRTYQSTAQRIYKWAVEDPNVRVYLVQKCLGYTIVESSD
jgi:hypothetical protein